MPRTIGSTRFSHSSPFASVTVLVPSLMTRRRADRSPLRQSFSLFCSPDMNLFHQIYLDILGYAKFVCVPILQNQSIFIGKSNISRTELLSLAGLCMRVTM